MIKSASGLFYSNLYWSIPENTFAWPKIEIPHKIPVWKWLLRWDGRTDPEAIDVVRCGWQLCILVSSGSYLQKLRLVTGSIATSIFVQDNIALRFSIMWVLVGFSTAASHRSSQILDENSEFGLKMWASLGWMMRLIEKFVCTNQTFLAIVKPREDGVLTKCENVL